MAVTIVDEEPTAESDVLLKINYDETMSSAAHAFEIAAKLIRSLGRVDKRDSQGALNMIQAGICDGDQLGTRPDVGRGMGVS